MRRSAISHTVTEEDEQLPSAIKVYTVTILIDFFKITFTLTVQYH